MPKPLLMKRAGLWTACAIAASATAAEAQAPTGLVPIRTGTAIVQTLSTPTTERESLHLVTARLRLRAAFRVAVGGSA